MYQIVIQQMNGQTFAPKPILLRRWARKALRKKISSAEVTIRIVDVTEMSALNLTYRHKQGPTNVLSFPLSMGEEIDLDFPLLGDIVICADVVNQEAALQHKSQDAHWAHMIVHGIFHLLGYDHETENDATLMESLEIETLQALGFSNPYETGENSQHYE